MVLLVPVFSYADPGFPGGDDEPPGEVPIDGGASLLVAAAVAYGAKKYKDNKPKNEDNK